MFVSPKSPVAMLEYNWYGQVSEADAPIPALMLSKVYWCKPLLMYLRESAKLSELLMLNYYTAVHWLLTLFNNIKCHLLFNIQTVDNQTKSTLVLYYMLNKIKAIIWTLTLYIYITSYH